MALRSLKIGALAIGVALGLTACDPPMPPEMVIEIAERQFVCQEGEVSIAVPASLTSIAEGWSAILADQCPGMTPLIVSETEPADIVLSADVPSAAQCTPYAVTPWGVDAAAIVVFNSELASLNLTPLVAADIFSGKITDWADPAIAALNPDVTLSSLPIVLDNRATSAQIKALQTWFDRVAGSVVDLSGLKVDNTAGGQDRLYEFEEGTIAIAAFVDAFAAASTTASIVFGNGEADLVAPDNYTVTSASTQLIGKKGDGVNTAEVDPALEPTPPQGVDLAPTPYQGLVPINMHLCGTDNLATRAMARYLLRQDTQGNLAAASAVALPGAIRIMGIELVEVGLPVPEPVVAE
jgi:hypothetical protein